MKASNSCKIQVITMGNKVEMFSPDVASNFSSDSVKI